MSENNNLESDNSAGADLPAVNAGRRRFTTAGVAATGVLLTLASSSVLAEGCTAGISASAYGSMQPSRHPNSNGPLACGLSPGGWHKGDVYPNYWPKTVPTTTLYNSIFTDATTSQTFLDVINDNSNQVYRHVAAEYLNLESNAAIKAYLSLADLKKMSNLTYSTAGVLWGPEKVIAYLQAIQ